MTVEAVLIWIVLGAVAGWLAGKIVKGHGLGLVGNILVGIAGSFVGGWLGGQLGISGTTTGGLSLASIATAVIGSIILLYLIGFLKKT
jgi:uncharacterized membrane protein YeaQ/YmgE (transglycosylase-associated protein family)